MRRDFSLLVGDPDRESSAVTISHRDMLSVRRTYRALVDGPFIESERTVALASETVRTAQCFLDKQPEAAYLDPWEYTAFVEGHIVTLKQKVPREYY